ncbi:MAG: DUF262 domain-containing protein [Dehalococcoidia bacterium]|nr:DUF262 domain-containing protein [Dehalococcoidia bacterium]
MAEVRIYEDENWVNEIDPEQEFLENRRLFTQPYDLVITSLMDQIDDGTVHLRQINDHPRFQRRYVWPDRLASRLIESILMDVPIPPCYLAQNRDYRLEVIDGQQRIYSIYRFITNQFKLTNLEVLSESNGKAFFELPEFLRRKITTYTLRCVVVTNNSDPEIRFEVFERLNTNTVPLNAQELRNSISRGSLIDLLGELTTHPTWLQILNRKGPDRRMRDEELILRFFAFHIRGPENYKTPQKHWLNEVASQGRSYSPEQIQQLTSVWKNTLDNCLLVFRPEECFRRIPLERRQVINRALMDLIMYSLSGLSPETVNSGAKQFYKRYKRLLRDSEFDDLITRSIDHKSRTLRRFELWSQRITSDLF